MIQYLPFRMQVRFSAALLAVAVVTANGSPLAGQSPQAVHQLADQSAAGSPSTMGAAATEVGKGRILLVLPFDNLTDASASLSESSIQPNSQPSPQAASQQSSQPGAFTTGAPASLDWLREAAPEVLNSRFTSAGFLPLSRQDRLYALDHLGLPESFQPSRATALKLAQTLDADYILIGSYRATGTNLVLEARIVDVAKLKISEEVTESGPTAKLIPLLNSLAWKLTRTLDPQFGVAEETFRAAGSGIRLDAFEQYIRGLTEASASERLRHLKKATDLNPNFTDAWLATGRLQFVTQNYEDAAISFGKVTRGDPSEPEAGFYRGLALMFTGNYLKAEDAFAAVARVLPLPEVVNNEGVASSRRGYDAIALFRQAVASDPTEADYHFNLAVSLHAHGDKAEALKEMDQSLKLHASDSEARAAESAWKSGFERTGLERTGPDRAGLDRTGSAAGATEPLERIKRSYNGAGFRQAAMMMDQVEEARLEALPIAERAARLSKSAHEKLDRGLLLESEREYMAALSADDRSFEAHAGLAEVRERSGDTDAARKEAQASIQRKPNLEAYMVLARLDLSANNLIQARDEGAEAVRLDSSNKAARDLKKSIDAKIEERAATDVKTPSVSSPAPPSTSVKPGGSAPRE